MAHVSREQLEAHLSKITARNRDPLAGVYGPDSLTWKTTKEALLFLGGGRAILLQMAHPFVAYAVDQHSTTRNDPQGRFRRTFEGIHSILFGDLETALRSARRIHALHETIKGKIPERIGPFDETTSYDANQEDALLWVFATLADTTVRIYETVLHPLSLEEKNRFWEEAKLFGYLFGIPDSVMPPDWPSFEEYNRKMWDSAVLTPSRPAKEIAGLLFQGRNFLVDPVLKWYRLMTAGFLPERIREGYGLSFGRGQRMVFSGSLGALRLVWPRLPARLRYLPAYVEARRRLKGLPPHDGFGRLAEKSVIAVLAKRPEAKSG